MRIFLDANILVSVLNKEYPLYSCTARIVSLTNKDNKVSVYTSPVCLAIAFYFSEKKSGTAMAKKKIELFAKGLTIAGTGENEVLLSLRNKKINDFEDGIEYYSAINSKCNLIITEDVDDYYFSEIEVIRPEAFLKKYFL